MTNLTSNKDLKTFVSSVPAWRYYDGQQCRVLRPQRDFGAVRSSLVLGAAVLWCCSQFSGTVHSSLVLGAAVLWWWSSGAVCSGKKCACHLIGTQATDIVSRDEQWPHTSPTHYLSLLFLPSACIFVSSHFHVHT